MSIPHPIYEFSRKKLKRDIGERNNLIIDNSEIDDDLALKLAKERIDFKILSKEQIKFIDNVTETIRIAANIFCFSWKPTFKSIYADYKKRRLNNQSKDEFDCDDLFELDTAYINNIEYKNSTKADYKFSFDIFNKWDPNLKQSYYSYLKGSVHNFIVESQLELFEKPTYKDKEKHLKEKKEEWIKEHKNDTDFNIDDFNPKEYKLKWIKEQDIYRDKENEPIDDTERTNRTKRTITEQTKNSLAELVDEKEKNVLEGRIKTTLDNFKQKIYNPNKEDAALSLGTLLAIWINGYGLLGYNIFAQVLNNYDFSRILLNEYKQETRKINIEHFVDAYWENQSMLDEKNKDFYVGIKGLSLNKFIANYFKKNPCKVSTTFGKLEKLNKNC